MDLQAVKMYLFKRCFVVTVICLISACSQHKPTETVVIPATTTLKVKPDEVRIIQPKNFVIGSANAIEVQELRAITSNDLLSVQANFLNNRGRRDIFYYRIRWLDKAGVQIGQYEPWQSETIEGFQSSLLTFRAPIPEINDFRIEIRSRD